MMIIVGKYAASNWVIRQGIILDTDRKCFTKTYRILGLFKYQEPCETLPKSDYVLMFRTLYAKCEPCELEAFESSSMIQLSMVYRKNRRLIIHESRNMEEIRDLALELAATFHLKIRDSATDRRKPTWISLSPVGL